MQTATLVIILIKLISVGNRYDMKQASLPFMREELGSLGMIHGRQNIKDR